MNADFPVWAHLLETCNWLPKGPHSALGYLAPEEFAARSSQNQRAG